MKNGKVAIIVIAGILVLLFAWTALVSVARMFYYDVAGADRGYIPGWEYAPAVSGGVIEDLDCGEITDVRVSIVSHGVELVPSDRFGYSVTGAEQIEVRLSPVGELEIKRREPIVDIFGFNPSGTVSIYYPAGTEFSGVRVEAVSGAVSARDFSADEIKISTVSGKITVDSVTADTLDADTVSGAVTGDRVTVLEARVETVSGKVDFAGLAAEILRVDTVSGDLNVTGEVTDHTRFNSMSGGARLEYKGSERDYTVDFSGISGKARVGNGGSGQGIFGTGPRLIEMDTVSGNLTVSFS